MEKRRPGRPVGRSDIRDKLLAAARERFLNTPYSKVTTREIAELAGSNLAMIHYYFGSKEGLYKAVLGDVAEPLEQAWHDESSNRSLTDLLNTYYQVMAPNSELTSAISSALSTEKSPGRDFVLSRLLDRQLPQFDALLESMRSNGGQSGPRDAEDLLPQHDVAAFRDEGSLRTGVWSDGGRALHEPPRGPQLPPDGKRPARCPELTFSG